MPAPGGLVRSRVQCWHPVAAGGVRAAQRALHHGLALLLPCGALQAEQLTRLLHDFYTADQKYSFVHAFNHRQSEFDFKRMLDSLGHDTSQLPGS